MAEEKRQNDERIRTLERTLYGEQISGNKVEGIYSKVEKMYEQFTFLFRIYKVLMVFASATALGVITILIKMFLGGGQ